MRQFNFFFIIAILLTISCAPRQRQPKIAKREKPKVSATVVVDQFLSALKARDIQKAYDKVRIIHSDREGYVNRLEAVYSEYDIKIVNYKLLATQLYSETAIVVAEIEINKKISPDSAERVNKTYRNKYDLTVFNKEWKITHDECIENCTEAF